MGTNKPRIQVYLSPWIAEALEDYRAEPKLSQSQAVEQILADFFNEAAPQSQALAPVLGHNPEMKRLEDSVRASLDAIAEIKSQIEAIQSHSKLHDEALNSLNIALAGVRGKQWLFNDRLAYLYEKQSLSEDNSPNDSPNDSPDELTDELPEAVGSELPDDSLSYSTNELATEANYELSLTVNSELSDDSPDELPEAVSSELSDDSPDELPEAVSSELPDDSPDELPEAVSSELPDDSPDELPTDALPVEESEGEDTELPILKALGVKIHSQAELARRLQVSDSTLSRKRNAPDFAAWSRKRDLQGMEWKYNKTAQNYEGRFPDTSK